MVTKVEKERDILQANTVVPNAYLLDFQKMLLGSFRWHQHLEHSICIWIDKVAFALLVVESHTGYVTGYNYAAVLTGGRHWTQTLPIRLFILYRLVTGKQKGVKLPKMV